jgi:hypothetical protein
VASRRQNVLRLEEELRELVREVVQEEMRSRAFAWLTADEAALKFGITADAVRRRVREGRLPGRTHAGRVYVDMVEFDRLLRHRR